MKFFLLPFLFFSIAISAQNTSKYQTFFEKGNGNQSADYQTTIAYYKMLDADFSTIEMKEMGLTDSGEPLNIVIFNPDKNFNFTEINQTKAVILINNGIHAGEPDGIDATMQFFRDLATGKIKAPKNTVLVAIPVYNIGGLLKRNSTSRVNQDGPEEYGFRGNARNYDLNRDFIKSDTKNTKSFVEIFNLTNPDIFIDNHVSDGADYQYTLTYIMTQPDKLGKTLGDFFRNDMMPNLISNLQKKKIEMTPYVNVWNGTPDKGFEQFFESPRYATGYTSLFNTIGFVVETHMLKKYDARVKATYNFMQQTLEYTDDNYLKIKNKRRENSKQFSSGKMYPIKWEIDSSKVDYFAFLGYEGGYKKSDVTGANRLYYDRSKPYKKEIPYYDHYKSVKEIAIPKAYIVPKSWWPVVDLLKANHVAYSQIQNDTAINVESYRIEDYKTSTNAYEGHYIHRNTKVSANMELRNFKKDDFIVTTNQPAIKYLLETLEPEGIDSFFNWNFFDTILQQKEGYSDYVFEDLATEILKENPEMKSEFDQKKASDKSFSEHPEIELDWVYKHSKYYEKAHLQYPIYRVVN